jgi:hypothetical protein
MNNGFAAMIESVTNADQVYQKQYLNDSVYLISITLALMNLQTAWQDQLYTDKSNYLVASMSTDASTSMESKAMQVAYDTDSSKRDAQCNAVQSIVQGTQSQVNADNSDRQQNYSLINAFKGYFNLSISVLKG